MHCLNRTPSTKKTQLDGNYSALSQKFGALEAGRCSTPNRNHFVPSSLHNSEIIQIRDVRIVDDARNFACRGDVVPPFLAETYQSVVKLDPACDPINFSCSQQTTSSTLSRENSAKRAFPKNIEGSEKKTNQQVKRKNSFAETLKKCTDKVLIFKTDPPTVNGKAAISKDVSCSSLKSKNSISNSSLKETDAENSVNAELAQMMFNEGRDIRKHQSKEAS